MVMWGWLDRARTSNAKHGEKGILTLWSRRPNADASHG